MIAGRTNFRSGSSNYNVSAVAAFPDFNFASGEHFRRLRLAEQRAIALFMMLLDGSHKAECRRKFRESLFLCGFCKSVVHICPLVILTLCGVEQVLGGIADAVQFFEPHLRMLFLIVRRLQEKCGDLLIALFFCLGSKISILIACL